MTVKSIAAVETANESADKKSAEEMAFNAALEAAVNSATDADRTFVEKLRTDTPAAAVHTVTPQIAALLFTKHNTHNRDFALNKAKQRAAAMTRGEWHFTGQGFSIYKDGQLADGQHRCAAVVLSNMPQVFNISTGVEIKAGPAIDTGLSTRTSGDGLKMSGINDGKLVSAVCERVMKYQRKLSGVSDKPSVYEIEAWYIGNRHDVDAGIKMAQNILAKVNEPALGMSESASIAVAAMIGGYQPAIVHNFIGGIQMGVADYPECPVVDLSRQFVKAKTSRNKDHGLSAEQRMALSFKGLALFALNKSVRSVTYKKGKEPLPAPTPPTVGGDLIAAE